MHGLVALAQEHAGDTNVLDLIAKELEFRRGRRASELARSLAAARGGAALPTLPVSLANQPASATVGVDTASAAKAGVRVRLEMFVQEGYKESGEWRKVRQVAESLHAHLNTPDSVSRIDQANMPRRGSAEVQAVFRDFAHSLGFESERGGLFADMDLGLRPDYFLRLGDTGVLLEVERGKTTMNNMHLLDLWKCHICAHAHYLFLLVPIVLRQNATGAPRAEFDTVRRHLSTFFLPQNYSNVRGLCLYGY